MMGDLTRLTYRQLAEALGLKSADAARMKAKRESAKPGTRWRIIPGNHPSDPVHVELPADALPPTPPERRTPPPPAAAPAPEETPPNTDGLAVLIGDLSGRLVAETEAHGHTRAELAGVRAELTGTREAIEAKEAELETLRGRNAFLLGELNRPWWKLWG